ncbi:glutathione-dependent formaldehyde dehydrogenase [Acetobacteraceae bacterium H6797]|nr:glutathione-dependent formaldehyde dehydrogenase [Acetobacteraceae bacterium H6797]
MRALTWHGRGDIRCDTVPDPKIEHERDAIIKVTSCAICGSDLHLMGGFVPTMESGDILGHECMGEVVEVGRGNTALKPGDRVVVPFTICCGECRQCKWGNWSCCERTNPNGAMQAQQYGYPLAGLFGYSHITGGYAGGQAEYIRVPYADVGPLKILEEITDEQVLFLSDILPTAYMAAENCGLKGGETVAIWGAGPVGLLAIRCAFLLGAGRVISIDTVPERLAMAREAGAETLDYADGGDLHQHILELTKGAGPDAVIEAVGLESHGATTAQSIASTVMSKTVSLERPFALNQAILSCRPAGTISMPGVFAGQVGPIAMGALMQKGLTLRTGQTHMLRYMKPLLEHIQAGRIDATGIITHRATLEDGPNLYDLFREKKDGCVKVVLKP